MKQAVSEIIGDYFTKAFVLGLSLLLIVPTVCKMYDYLSKRNNSTATEAIVLTDPDIGSDLACRPLVRYTDHLGNEHELKSKISFYWIFAPKKGEELKVYYSKNAPNKAFIDSLYYYILLPSQLFLMGAVPFFCVLMGRVKKDSSPVETCGQYLPSQSD